MSGSLIGGVIGAGIGLFIGGPTGAMYGWSAGSMAGGLLFPQHVDGPRLTDLKPQSSEYGRPIPIVYGTVGIGGNVIWASDYVQEESDSGGKGGPSVTTYSYFGNFAVAFCEGEATITRMWAGPEKRLIYDGFVLADGGTVRFYKGTEDQMPDPLIESYLGAGNVPAFRGTCYVVFEHFPLAKDGNTLPFITAEITTGGGGETCSVDYTMVGTWPNIRALYDRPPIKLGSYTNMRVSYGEHPTATDNDGNVYAAVIEYGTSNWYIKKVSSSSPITEALLPLSMFSAEECSIAYDPKNNVLGVIQIGTTNFALIDCASFYVMSWEILSIPKADIIYSYNEARFRMFDSEPHYMNGVLSPDSFGVTHIRNSGRLIECGPHGIAVGVDGGLLRGNTETYLNGVSISNLCAQVYDPVRDRLLSLSSASDGFCGYYDFSTGETVVPADVGTVPRLYAQYFPSVDRIVYLAGAQLVVMNPADLSATSFPDECVLFSTGLVYADGVTPVLKDSAALIPIPLPNVHNKLAVFPTFVVGATLDIFTFGIGTSPKGVTLASVVADLSDRAGESRHDVSQLENDIVDGYTIARQTTVRNAIDALRPAYFFDAVESGGQIKYVKRGGAPVATIDADDLNARAGGQESGDPLLTTRQMEVELPRLVNVNYLLAATDYSPATKLAKRLVGASGNESTMELPLVLTDTKAQEVADVNLQVSWIQRLSYAFNLPRKYSHLEPTDHIIVKGSGMRLTKVSRTPAGTLSCEAVADGSTFYTPNTAVDETPANEQTVYVPGITSLELM
jgi:hypothetical protein